MEKWWGRSDQTIADHVGATKLVVSKARARYAKEHGLTLPEEVTDRLGRKVGVAYRGSEYVGDRSVPRITTLKRGNCTSYQTYVGGKKVGLGSNDLAAAEKRLVEIIGGESQKAEVRKSATSLEAVRTAVERSGFPAEAFKAGKKYPGLSGFSVSGLVITCSSLGTIEAVTNAVGRCLLLRQTVDPSSRAVLVCHKEDGARALADAASAIGVELMTPDELVSSLRGLSPEATAERDAGHAALVGFRERLIRSMVLKAVGGGERTVGEMISYHITKVSPKPDTTETRKIMTAMVKEGVLARREQRNANGIYSELYSAATDEKAPRFTAGP